MSTCSRLWPGLRASLRAHPEAWPCKDRSATIRFSLAFSSSSLKLTQSLHLRGHQPGILLLIEIRRLADASLLAKFCRAVLSLLQYKRDLSLKTSTPYGTLLAPWGIINGNSVQTGLNCWGHVNNSAKDTGRCSMSVTCFDSLLRDRPYHYWKVRFVHKRSIPTVSAPFEEIGL
jgi:hypothetical protein